MSHATQNFAPHLLSALHCHIIIPISTMNLRLEEHHRNDNKRQILSTAEQFLLYTNLQESKKMNHQDCFLDTNDETDSCASSTIEIQLSRGITGETSSPLLLDYQQKYAKCLVSGVFASSIRWALTPFDNVKCKMQVEPSKYPTFVSGIRITWQRQGLSGLYRGLAPTVLAYASQTGTKYMMYDLFKDSSVQVFGSEFCYNHKDAIYILSAAAAEAIADVAMAPWEMIKVKVQTTPKNFPSRFIPALVTMLQDRRKYQFPFGTLRPLWSRQIVGTVANFYTFECVTEYIYSSDHIRSLFLAARDDNGTSASGKLLVTCVAGCISGVISSVLSHPFDVMVSLRTQHPNQAMWTTVQNYGWANLFTRGLGPRVGLTSSILCVQWFLYDSCRTFLGMPTSGAAATGTFADEAM